MLRIYEMQAEFLKALAHPTRLRIMNRLRDEKELCVCHILEDLDMDQSNVSQHLRVLKKAGIVTSNKHGLKVYYKPTDPDVYKLIDQLGPLLSNRLETMSAALRMEV